jgi:capsular polysaccharide biosynthesis protein
MNNFFDNQRILNVIWKRKFHFIIIGVIAVILAAFFQGLLSLSQNSNLRQGFIPPISGF